RHQLALLRRHGSGSSARAAGRVGRVTATPGSPIHLGVVHVTEYRYPEPAWDSFNEVRLSPTDDHAQSLLSFELELSPEATVRSHLDYYGNRAHQFHIGGASPARHRGPLERG